MNPVASPPTSSAASTESPSSPRTSRCRQSRRRQNWFQFARLIHSIYGRGHSLPDLDWIQSLGLLAVKLGQVHALRIDFLDREKCEHLARLYRRNAILAPQDFRALLRAAAGGEGFLDHFEHIEPTPLASASVGQVHRAQLKDGRTVVVKAVKKDVREQFTADVASLKRLFRLCNLLYPKLRQVGDPVGILSDIEEYTLSELDLRHEAGCILEFYKWLWYNDL